MSQVGICRARSGLFSAVAVAAFFLGMLKIVGCGSSVNDASAARSLPKPVGARAISRHYVEVTYPTIVGVLAEAHSVYQIRAEDGTILRVDAARLAPNGDAVVLTTAAQEDIP